MVDFLVVGRIGRPHGVKGEANITLYTDFPERLVKGKTLWVSEHYHPIVICTRRWHRQNLLLSFEGYTSREDIASLCNQFLYVRTDDLPPLQEGEFYHHQLLGMKVFAINTDHAQNSSSEKQQEPQYLGTIKEILSTGANDVYVISNGTNKEILIPALESTIVEINVELAEMKVHLLSGLID